MSLTRIVEYVFFFALLGLSGYLVWLIATPFISALALAAVIVTIANPLYKYLIPKMPRQNHSLAAFSATVIVFIVGILPIAVMTTLVVNELVDLYQDLNYTETTSLSATINSVETQIAQVIPGFTVDLTAQMQAVFEWLTGNLANIFAGTISTFFLFFIALIGSFYFFRDGQELLQLVIKASPLPDDEDRAILHRLAQAVRVVATGTLLVALIQGTLAAIGLTIFDVDRAILLGGVVAIAAMIPGVGTGVIMLPIVAILLWTGDMFAGIGLLIWSIIVVGLVDNFLGPYLMSRGNNMHPFIILISVLGGLSVFGLIGFLIGPMVVALFLVLLEIYNQYIIKDQRVADDISSDI